MHLTQNKEFINKMCALLDEYQVDTITHVPNNVFAYNIICSIEDCGARKIEVYRTLKNKQVFVVKQKGALGEEEDDDDIINPPR